MTLASQVQNLAIRIGTEFKTHAARIGNLASLATTEKGSLVGALNEVKVIADAATGGGGGGASINDTTPSGSTTFSSTKINTELATKVALTGNQTVAGIKTFSSAPVVPDGSFAIAKTSGLQAALDAKTTLAAVQTALIDAAPGTLDTLNELAAAIGDDANFAATTATSLGNRVRTDTAAQGLNSTQQGNARTNIAAASAVDVGDTTTNFVTTFEAALI